jgi:hypothetical protein
MQEAQKTFTFSAYKNAETAQIYFRATSVKKNVKSRATSPMDNPMGK